MNPGEPFARIERNLTLDQTPKSPMRIEPTTSDNRRSGARPGRPLGPAQGTHTDARGDKPHPYEQWRVRVANRTINESESESSRGKAGNGQKFAANPGGFGPQAASRECAIGAC